jgi:hypothetical protein
MAHPIVSESIAIDIAEMFALCRVDKEWVWLEKSNVVIDAAGKNV